MTNLDLSYDSLGNITAMTGNGTYTDGGVNHVVQAYTPFNEDGTPGEPVILDAERALEIIEQIAVSAECDPADPPNSCEW